MDRTPDYEIDEHFRSIEQLSDGTKVVIRMLRPSDQELLARGFEQLTQRSRYQRFLSIKPSLSRHEVDYLVDIDGFNHLALGAGLGDERVDDDGIEQGLGVARFVRYEEEPDTAEVAVTVIDDYQGKGLGRRLLGYLVQAASERGIRRFRADCFATNIAMRRLFEELGPTEVLDRAGAVVTLDITLADEQGGDPEHRHHVR
ncbi:MAG: N-acetyltransferase family protein [Persicimonas sp.]